jgi:hypothetical protein
VCFYDESQFKSVVNHCEHQFSNLICQKRYHVRMHFSLSLSLSLSFYLRKQLIMKRVNERERNGHYNANIKTVSFLLPDAIRADNGAFNARMYIHIPLYLISTFSSGFAHHSTVLAASSTDVTRRSHQSG